MAIKTPVVYWQQIETWKDHKKYKSTIIKIFFFLISQVVLYIKHLETDDTDECSREMSWPVNQYGGGYMCILGQEKQGNSCWRQSTCIIMWGTFLWFTDDKSTGRVESVVRVGAGGVWDPRTFSSSLFSQCFGNITEDCAIDCNRRNQTAHFPCTSTM